MPAPAPASKVMSLSDAVRRCVRPGMMLHIETGPRAAVNELARQFWGKNPGFTLVMLRLGGGHAGHLVLGGLLKKIIGSSYVDPYPAPAPMRAVQAAYRERTVELETWSLMSLLQRLMAGAQGLPFLPTRSLLGTSFEEENSPTFRILEDPFGTGTRVGIVKPLNPDLSFVHGVAADSEGNVISFPPSEEAFWGAKASRGVVATVEKVLPTEVIRRYAHLVKLPSHNVVAVCHTPFGAHPGRLVSLRFPPVPGYDEDEEFQTEHRRASRDPRTYTEWVHRWVLDLPDHDGYLKQLGRERLAALRRKARERPFTLEEALGELPDGPPGPCTEIEMMVVAAARMMVERVAAAGYTAILAGVGTSDIAASLAYYMLRQQGSDVRLIVGTGMYGYIPKPGHGGNVATATMLSDTIDMYGVVVGGANARCLAALGAGQIDRSGNTNSTKLSEELFLTGSGGANDATSGAAEVIVVAEQARRRFLDRVPFVTCSGARVRTLVSSMGVYEKEPGGEFVLTRYFPAPAQPDAESAVRRIQESCGWKLRVAPALAPVPPPTARELAMLRRLDPERVFLGPEG